MVDRGRATGALWNAPLSSVRPMTAEELWAELNKRIQYPYKLGAVDCIKNRDAQIRVEIMDCVLAEARDCGCALRWGSSRD